MKVGVRCFYVVGRPLVNFRRIRSLFDAPTDNYNGIIAGLTSDIFGLRKQISVPLSLSSPPHSLATAHLVHPLSPLCFRSCPMRSHGPKPSLLSASNPLARASEKLSRTRPRQSSPLCPGHPQTSTKHLRFLIWTPQPFNLDRPI